MRQVRWGARALQTSHGGQKNQRYRDGHCESGRKNHCYRDSHCEKDY
jgi:hypothetical protein